MKSTLRKMLTFLAASACAALLMMMGCAKDAINEQPTLTIQYLDKETGAELQHTVLDTIVHVGEYRHLPPAISGYVFASGASDSTAGIIGPNQHITLKYFYDRVPRSITIRYLDLATDQDIKPAVVDISVAAGEAYSYSAPTIDGYEFNPAASDTASGVLGETEHRIIRFYYDRLNRSVTIKYLENGTDAQLRDSVQHLDVPAGNYHIPPVIPGYKFNLEATDFGTGTVAAGESITITFRYDKLQRSVTIKCLDFSTWREAAPTVQHDDVQAGPYTYYAPAISGYTFNAAQSDSTVTGTLGEHENLVITFYYDRVQQPATVEIICKNLVGNELQRNGYSIAPGLYSYTAPIISGYTASGLAPESAPAAGVAQEGEHITIIFTYAPLQRSIVVRYLDAVTDLEIKKAELYADVPEGAYDYSAAVVSIAGYDFNAAASDPVVGSIGADENITIRLKYSKRKRPVVVKYLEVGTGLELKPKLEVEDAPAGQYFAPAVITGYALNIAASDFAEEQVVAPGETTYINYRYDKVEQSVTIYYLDAANGQELKTHVTHGVDVGTHTYTPDNITDYTFNAALSNSGTVSVGKWQHVILKFFYSKNGGTIVITCKDETNATIQSVAFDIAAGAYNYSTPPTIANHAYNKLSDASDPVSGTVAPGETKNIVHLYNRLGTVTVKCLDFATGRRLRSDVVHTIEPIGAYGPYTPPTITGYDFNLAESDPAAGTLLTAGESKVITFYYNKTVQCLTINYYLWGDESTILDDRQPPLPNSLPLPKKLPAPRNTPVPPGDGGKHGYNLYTTVTHCDAAEGPYHHASPEIEGYYLADTSDSGSGTLGKNQKDTINFFYGVMGSITINYRDGGPTPFKTESFRVMPGTHTYSKYPAFIPEYYEYSNGSVNSSYMERNNGMYNKDTPTGFEVSVVDGEHLTIDMDYNAPNMLVVKGEIVWAFDYITPRMRPTQITLELHAGKYNDMWEGVAGPKVAEVTLTVTAPTANANSGLGDAQQYAFNGAFPAFDEEGKEILYYVTPPAFANYDQQGGWNGTDPWDYSKGAFNIGYALQVGTVEINCVDEDWNTIKQEMHKVLAGAYSYSPPTIEGYAFDYADGDAASGTINTNEYKYVTFHYKKVQTIKSFRVLHWVKGEASHRYESTESLSLLPNQSIDYTSYKQQSLLDAGFSYAGGEHRPHETGAGYNHGTIILWYSQAEAEYSVYLRFAGDETSGTRPWTVPATLYRTTYNSANQQVGAPRKVGEAQVEAPAVTPAAGSSYDERNFSFGVVPLIDGAGNRYEYSVEWNDGNALPDYSGTFSPDGSTATYVKTATLKVEHRETFTETILATDYPVVSWPADATVQAMASAAGTNGNYIRYDLFPHSYNSHYEVEVSPDNSEVTIKLYYVIPTR